MRHLACLVAIAILLPVAGCDFYFGGDDDDDCPYGVGDGAYYSPELLRNPDTGQCESWDNNYPPDYPCDSACGYPCPQPGSDIAVPTPTWGMCDSFCEGFDETTCLDSSGCRGVYADVEGTRSFVACWPTDMTGPLQGGSCEGRDAFTCSQYEDCSAVHVCNNTGGDQPLDPSECDVGSFSSCVSEKTGCYSTSDCGDGQVCNADTLCLPPPGCGDSTGGNQPGLIDCTDQCYGFCATDPTPACSILDENTCITRSDCVPYYEGINCTCDDTGACDCAEWVFDTCDDVPPPAP